MNGKQLDRRLQREISNPIDQVQTRQNLPSHYRLLSRDPQSPAAETTPWTGSTPHHPTGVVQQSHQIQQSFPKDPVNHRMRENQQ